jgi:hypothetical protein
MERKQSFTAAELLHVYDKPAGVKDLRGERMTFAAIEPRTKAMGPRSLPAACREPNNTLEHNNA